MVKSKKEKCRYDYECKLVCLIFGREEYLFVCFVCLFLKKENRSKM